MSTQNRDPRVRGALPLRTAQNGSLLFRNYRDVGSLLRERGRRTRGGRREGEGGKTRKKERRKVRQAGLRRRATVTTTAAAAAAAVGRKFKIEYLASNFHRSSKNRAVSYLAGGPTLGCSPPRSSPPPPPVPLPPTASRTEERRRKEKRGEQPSPYRRYSATG